MTTHEPVLQIPLDPPLRKGEGFIVPFMFPPFVKGGRGDSPDSRFRKIQGDFRPFPGFALHPYLALVGFHDIVDDCQTQTRS